MKRIFSLILAALLLAGTITGCGDTAEETTAAAVETQPVETESETLFMEDNLPEDLDFGGTAVNTFGWEEVAIIEFFAEEMNGDVVNDAVFQRNQVVEERLNVSLEYTLAPGNNANHQAWAGTVMSSTMAGDGANDIIAGYSMAPTILAYNRVLIDLLTLDYIDFAMPWWPSSLIDEAVCGGKLYFCSGDISTNMISMLYCMFYNKTVATNQGLEDFYPLVKNGTWTLDKMIELASGCYVDVNGDGTKDPGDAYGYVVQPVYIDPFFFASGLRTTVQDENGLHVLSPEFSGERTQELLVKLVDMFKTDAMFLAGYTMEGYDHVRNAFMEDRALFFDTEISYATNYLRQSEASYGILPIPKYDEAQKEYSTIMSFPYTLYGVPVDAKDPDMSAAVLECLASESFRTVSPALFEVALKVKFSQDAESSEMYDIIRSSATFDFGRIFCTNLDSLTFSMFRDSVNKGSTDWMSTFQSKKKTLETKLETVVTALTTEQ